jgi:hypothetical protein
MMVCGVCKPNFASPSAIAMLGSAKDVAITAFARSRLIISSAFSVCTEGYPSIAVSARGFGQGSCGPDAVAHLEPTELAALRLSKLWFPLQPIAVRDLEVIAALLLPQPYLMLCSFIEDVQVGTS